MSTGEDTYPRRGHLIVAGAIALLGLIATFAYALRSTPYTMFFFLVIGQTSMLLAVAIYVYVIVRDIQARLAHRTQRTFEPGQFIFHKGNLGDCMYVITKGEVDIVLEGPDETAIDRLGPSDYFGEAAILDANPAPRYVSARAATHVETLTIGRREFAAMYEHVPSVLIEAVLKQRREER